VGSQAIHQQQSRIKRLGYKFQQFVQQPNGQQMNRSNNVIGYSSGTRVRVCKRLNQNCASQQTTARCSYNARCVVQTCSNRQLQQETPVINGNQMCACNRKWPTQGHSSRRTRPTTQNSVTSPTTALATGRSVCNRKNQTTNKVNVRVQTAYKRQQRNRAA